MAACVYIPVQNSEEEVRVALDNLPRDASDIIDILKAEQAPLDLWLIIAREYFKQGKIEQFRQILEEGSSPEIDEYYADVKRERVAILCALGVYYTYLGKIEAKHREKDDNFSRATQLYERAKKISNIESSVWVGKGLISLAKGELDQASASFGVLKEDDGNVATLLCQACIHFNNGRYSDSLDLYKRVVRVHPSCPAPVRLGLGLCYYKMGQSGKARKSFQRVLQLDCENVEALVALGVMDLQTNEASGIKNGMINLQRAFELDPYNATSLNYLANHFFFTGQHFLVEQLTETALSVTNHGPTKSHSYYNLARSYHSKGDYEKAGVYYMASVNEISKPHDFVLPYYGLGQVQLKFGDLKSSLSSFEKVLEVYPENCESLKAIGHIHVQLGQADKAMDFLKKSVRIDPRDYQAFMDLGELLVSSDGSAALDAFKTAHSLLKKRGEEVPIELLNYIGVLHFERGELESAEQYMKDALGGGIWNLWIRPAGNNGSYHTLESNSPIYHYKDVEIFSRVEEDGALVDVPWDKVTVLFNLARLFEELHDSGTACVLYRLILFKYPEYCDAYLRLAAIAKARNNIQLSIELVGEVLKIDYKCCDALSMLGDLELKNDDWVKAKETLRSSLDAADGKDSYATLSLGNWNYFAALRSEKKAPKLEATHIEKARELYSKVLAQHSSNLYAANGAGLVLAEKGHFEVSKDIFTQVQEAASGSIFVQIPDVWINLAHVYYAQGNFALAVKMYQNCMRKYFYNTDVHIHLYLARTYYEAEQWQDCKKALLRAIHIAPSTHTLRFNVGVTMQKFSASTLQKEKKTADEVRLTVSELKNAVRVFVQLSAASSLNIHGFDEKKMETHVGYCKHLLEAAKKHCEAAEAEEQQIKQKIELARQFSIAEEARRKAEQQRKSQMERRKQEDELKRVMQQEEQFQRVKDQWRSNAPVQSKRKERTRMEEEEGGGGNGSEQRKRRGGGKRRRKEKYSSENRLEAESQDELEEEDVFRQEASPPQDNTHDALAAAGLEDSDYEDQDVLPVVATRKRWDSSASEDEEIGQVKSHYESDAEHTTRHHQFEKKTKQEQVGWRLKAVSSK